MTDDDPIEALLRRHAPPAIDDDGFTARTMRALPAVARLDSARALVLEQRRYAAQARRWRWATAGVVAGTLVATAIAAVSPDPFAIRLDPAPAPWLPLSLLLAAGSLWYAWKEFRAN
jgi:hypothetical protein